MQDRHDLHIAAESTSLIAAVFAGGPLGFIAFAVVLASISLGAQALAEPGIVLASASIVLLPFGAYLIGRVKEDGRHNPARLLIAAVLLGGAVLAYQLQWGSLAGNVDETTSARRCGFWHLRGLDPRDGAVSEFMACRAFLTFDEKSKLCSVMRSDPRTDTFRIRMYCNSGRL